MRGIVGRCGLAGLAALASGAAMAQATGRPGSFPLHDEHGAATLIEITGIGSRSARMVGEFGPADILEMCERIGWKFYSPSFPFQGAFEDRRTIQICRNREQARPAERRRYVAEADCQERILRTPSGYTAILNGTRWETGAGRPLDAEFSSGHRRTAEKQFAILCPGAAGTGSASARIRRAAP